jgi:hypothetical protein
MTCWKALACSNRRLHLLFIPAALQLLAACATAPNPAEGPSASRVESGAIFDSRSKAISLPSVSLSVSPTQVSTGQQAVFTATLSKTSSTTTKATYSMSGTAVRGTHYTLNANQFSIPAGSVSGTVTLTEVSSNTSRTAKMTLTSGSSYTLSSSITSTVTLKSGSPTPTPSPSPSPSPTASPAPTPPPAASPTPTPSTGVWIAPRSDGQNGTGTQANPYNGSTPAKLVSLISTVIPANTIIHFAAGNYQVSSLIPKAGMKFLGAGKDITNFLWDGEPAGPMISSYGGSDGALISDLTLNGQQDVWGVTPLAVTIFDSNNVIIRNVRVTNFRGGGTENFLVTLFAQTINVTGALIEYCEVDHFFIGPGGATLLGFGHGGSGDPTTRISGTVQNNYIHDCPGVQALQGGGSNSIYQGNVVLNPEKGWYHDSYPISGSQVINNQFWNCVHYGIAATSNASGTDNPNNGCDGLVVSGNTITMDPSIMVPIAGVQLSGHYVSNSSVTANVITKTTATWTQYGYMITGPNPTVRNNQISAGFTNVPAH